METGLERAAESIGDITGPVMARFYAAHPAARAAFEHHGVGDPAALEAQMVENALMAAMTWLERPAEVRILFGGSVPHHQDTLAVPPGWYRGLMEATIDVIAGSIPPQNRAELELWDAIRRSLVQEIEAA
ncbi:hypothetical protein [Phenylobacterium soli]|uniref:Globin n=2 Tax=Phenylobacterium soli TaxID=2170551 RepID=A0A328AEB8_9CAUL|nr:hypothetical protein DJ017_00995 [Phenylobacterium soli]